MINPTSSDRNMLIILLSVLVVLGGCSQDSSKTADSDKSKEPGIIHYATGAESIKSYEKTKKKLKAIGESSKERYDF